MSTLEHEVSSHDRDAVVAFNKAINLIFYRMHEPSFVAKGNDDTQQSFDVPDEFVDERFKAFRAILVKKKAEQLQNNSDATTKAKVIREIVLKASSIPNIKFVLDALKRTDTFSMFNPMHRKIAGRLISFFQKIKSLDDLLAIAVFARDHINPFLFTFTMGVALLTRPDTSFVLLPTIAELFPDRFLHSKIFHEALEELSVVPDDARVPIQLDMTQTGSDDNVEQRLAYFREDFGINLCYFNWHLLNPFEALDIAHVARDRRGELWYYLHEQILARYNAERLCNDLFRVRPLNSLRDPIEEAYFPKLNILNSSHSWPPRFENCVLSDLDRPADSIKLSLAQLEHWIDRITNTIEMGFAVREDGSTVPLNTPDGIDHLGNMIESSILSPNRKYYGDLNNMGHAFIAFCHDPTYTFLETGGVMGDPATAMRDPVFYRWHAYLAAIFQLHKNLLPPYTANELQFAGITLTSLSVEMNVRRTVAPPNLLQTHWVNTDVNISRGLDFAPKGNVFARIKHLQHTPFVYKIRVENSHMAPLRGTVRIFLAPTKNEFDLLLTFNDQRLLMIELDRFTTTLAPGTNDIIRRSDESSVTTPFENTFEPEKLRERTDASTSLYCSCGWPQHMLIPRGSETGTPFTLFAMVSNLDADEVLDHDKDWSGARQCKEASSYCGRYHRKYPDKRAMGFPFDRPATENVISLKQFLKPNMITQGITIKFADKIYRK